MQLYRAVTSYSVSVCDAVYAVMSVERTLTAAWCTVPLSSSVLPLWFEQMYIWAFKSTVKKNRQKEIKEARRSFN